MIMGGRVLRGRRVKGEWIREESVGKGE